MICVMARDIIRGQVLNTIQSAWAVMGVVRLKMCMKTSVLIAMENTRGRQANHVRNAAERAKWAVLGAEGQDTPSVKIVVVRVK